MNIFRLRDEKDPGQGLVVRSLSGKERNRCSCRIQENFRDVSLVSGADFREDGRGFVYFDYDRDGWLDLGVVSPNRPRFRLLKKSNEFRRQ